MKKLSEIGKQIIDNRYPDRNKKLLNEAYNEFRIRIKTYDDWDDLIKLMEYDEHHWSLPFDICELIFDRLTALGIRNSYVLSWYAFILSAYGGPDGNQKADELMKEAEDYDNKMSENKS